MKMNSKSHVVSAVESFSHTKTLQVLKGDCSEGDWRE